MADKYVLRVTAGPSYDLAEHIEVPVNSPTPVKISTEHMDVELNVRIRNYHGLPRNSPVMSPYFDQEPHSRNNDQYSIAFRFTPKAPAPARVLKDGEDGESAGQEPEGISGADLQFGNDFDHPIRDRLPPGFRYAMKIVKWWIDPGLDGDPYADSPYLFGPALSSFNHIHVGPAILDEARGGLWVEEGGDQEWRKDIGAPEDGKTRMKWALQEDSKQYWVWEYGRTYAVDFFNAYLDFSEFALRLPGYTVPIMKYWDGQGLRYVLRNKKTGQNFLTILFTLYLKEDVIIDGSLKPEDARAHASHAPTTVEDQAAVVGYDGDMKPHYDGKSALEKATKHLSEMDISTQKTEVWGGNDAVD